MSELERCVELVRAAGLATGHADTHEALMREVLEQVEGLRAEVERLYTEQMGQADWVQRSRDLEKENATLRAEVERLQKRIGECEGALEAQEKATAQAERELAEARR